MVNFVVDSTFGLTRAFATEHNVRIVSLTLTLDGKEYTEGYQEDWTEFYSDYSRSKSAAKTSQPSPELFVKAVKDVLDGDPGSDVMILTIGDRLSGTIGSAKIAAKEFEGGKNRVVAFDSHNGGVSSLLLLEELIKARDGGADLDGLIALFDDLKDRISTRFIPASLTELARGGRVNKLLSRIGNILNIKPTFEYKANELHVIGKYLGMNRAMQNSVDALPKFERILICYIGDDKLVPALKDRLFRKYGMSHIDVYPMCPVGGAHIGVGTVGIITLIEKETEKTE